MENNNIIDDLNIRFSYNGDLGILQQKTMSNKQFVRILLQNGIITHKEYMALVQAIHDYFMEEIKNVLQNPQYYIDTIGG